MRDRRIGSLEATMWLLCVGYLAGFGASAALGVAKPGVIGVVSGLGLPAVILGIQTMRRRALRREATQLQRVVHDLTQQAKKIDIEEARASGAFDRWEKQ